jgi:asparagine synthase (glutamine-hydrolysing)
MEGSLCGVRDKMSGIFGICDPSRIVDAAAVAPMVAATTGSGDSCSEIVTGGACALGVARRWPFQQTASLPGVCVAVDAELLNRADLEKLVDSCGVKSTALSVAELVAALYLEKGAGFLEYLDGVFSIAVWDEKVHRLLLAIDRLGVNSLYWRQESNRLLFASRASGIRALINSAAEVNPHALMQYLLFSVVPAPLSIYKSVEKLRPGHLLIYENGEVSQQCYWDLDYVEDHGHGEEFWVREVREGLRSATHRNLQDCVPERTGAYLSGGTDSSSVTAFLSEWQAPANTFSIFFSEDRYNEISYARTAARKFSTRHSELCLSPKDALEAVPLLTRYFDEPFANSSAIGGYFCARLARQHGVDVLLAGDGGDELFAGNERYASDRRFSRYQAVPSLIRRGIIEPAVRMLPEAGSLSLPRRYVRRASIPNPRRIFSYGLFFSTPPEDIFEPEFLRAAPPNTWMDIANGHFQTGTQRSELNRLMYLDTKLILADNDLRKVLGTAELAGVRARFPLLDYRLAELSGRIPTRLKMKGSEKRYIFKRAMKEILPREILKKQKHGFGVPVALWFLQERKLEELMKDVLNDSRTKQRGYFRTGFVEQVMCQHRQVDAKNYGELIWYLLMLELWHREHLEIRTGTACVS